MIDYFSIALTHGLIALACWRLLGRDELDDAHDGDPGDRRTLARGREKPWLKNRQPEDRAGVRDA